MDKKDVNYYLSQEYPFKIETLREDDGGGYLITYPDLPGCVSDGETIDETIAMGEDARKAWIKTRIEKNLTIPEPYSQSNKYSGKIALRTPKSLHKRLIANAEKEGVSLNQYLVYLLSKESAEK